MQLAVYFLLLLGEICIIVKILKKSAYRSRFFFAARMHMVFQQSNLSVGGM